MPYRAFFRYFITSVLAAGGRFKHIPTGNARPQSWPQQQAAPAGQGGHWDGPKVLSAPGPSASAEVIPTAECPVVAYRQGAADLCAAYGLASAVCTSSATRPVPPRSLHAHGPRSGSGAGLEQHLFRGCCLLASLRARAQPPAAPHASLACLRCLHYDGRAADPDCARESGAVRAWLLAAWLLLGCRCLAAAAFASDRGRSGLCCAERRRFWPRA